MVRIEQKIAALVYIFDHRSVDYQIPAPEVLKFDRLLPSVLEKYSPTYSERLSNVAFTICYQVYLKNNPAATLEQFQEKFLTTAPGVAAYQEALNQASKKIKEKVSVEDIESLFVKDAAPSATE